MWSSTTRVTGMTPGRHPLPLRGWKKGPMTAVGWVTQPRPLSRDAVRGEKNSSQLDTGNIPETAPQVAWADRTTHI